MHKTGTPSTAYLYTGQRWDELLGLYDYNARWYDPGTGRFVSADTIVPTETDNQSIQPLTVSFSETALLSRLAQERAGLVEELYATGLASPQNLARYAYVLNSPICYSDTTGHCISGGNSEMGYSDCDENGNMLGNDPATGFKIWRVWRGGQTKLVLDDPGSQWDSFDEFKGEADTYAKYAAQSQHILQPLMEWLEDLQDGIEIILKAFAGAALIVPILLSILFAVSTPAWLFVGILLLSIALFWTFIAVVGGALVEMGYATAERWEQFKYAAPRAREAFEEGGYWWGQLTPYHSAD